mmetsp:Transcript_1779/g.2758  ORF Transcript_1779/g.2758 Transcript_1779/m.2758 type:complete len:116 (-) Transcript_1779:176-523(-)|eukprot:CAMPEP_0119014022 /NCGR_PEP_ID=MMETSP1176-20130426/9314_1 /TAXON_ID=265551 /ORGANISM="Synedropsis recta cf, Strain CCMP1620" /LENGTH=115 /DNA_ID=CAMNT_0006967157 /DNA_START=81 /DNA_END=428 /DNA_ORIENTATION=+
MSSITDESNEESFLDIDMSLGSPIKEPVAKNKNAKKKNKVSTSSSTGVSTTTTSMKGSTPAPWTRANQEDVMNEANKWITDLEMMRDEMHILSVKNAVLLDSMAMAGEACTTAGS